MIFPDLRLEALEVVLPEERITSSQMEERLSPLYQRLRLPEGRLELMTGIRERRLWPEGTLSSDASAMAGRAVLDKAGLSGNDIDLLIHASVSRDFMEPATASVVHHKMGLCPHTQVFDLSNACLGFLNACSLAAGMIGQGLIRRALVVTGENGRPLVEGTLKALLDPAHTRKSIKGHFASLTIGCGAAAAVLSSGDHAPEAPRLLGGAVRCDSRGSELCQGDRDADLLQMQTDSEQLLVQGVDLAKATWEEFCTTLNWNAETPDHVVTHQVGSAHRRKLYATLGLDEGKDHSSFEELGNIGSVSLPLTLAQAVEARDMNKGDHVALLGIGSGINCMMVGVEW